SYRNVLVLVPGFAEAHGNLGLALRSAGKLAEAVACFQQALRIDPGQAGILASLAESLLARGDHGAALDAICRSLAIQETAERKKLFVQCVKDLCLEQEAVELRPLLLRALREGWDRPDDLAHVSADLIKYGIAPLLAAEAAGRDLDASLAADNL